MRRRQSAPLGKQLEACFAGPDACFFGFEINSKFTEPLHRLEQQLRSSDNFRGRVRLLTETAFGTTDGTVEVRIDPHQEAFSSSMEASLEIRYVNASAPRGWVIRRGTPLSAADNEVSGQRYKTRRVHSIDAGCTLTERE